MWYESEVKGVLPINSSALVLFSGGQDSTTCLAWALSRFERVETVGFDYGQRHAIELQCRAPVVARIKAAFPQWAAKLGEDQVIGLDLLKSISDTALTRDVAIEMQANGLPNTFVPGRNILFLTVAAAIAYRRGIGTLVTGVCETDYSGYPDCRDDFVKAMQVTLNLGMAQRFNLETPLMWIDKADTWRLAQTLGGSLLREIILDETHTCYLGERSRRHEWGYGCGTCPACELRSNGYRKFIANP
jgi:7-cyano-7-deazaguanine synthase